MAGRIGNADDQLVSIGSFPTKFDATNALRLAVSDQARGEWVDRTPDRSRSRRTPRRWRPASRPPRLLVGDSTSISAIFTSRSATVTSPRLASSSTAPLRRRRRAHPPADRDGGRHDLHFLDASPDEALETARTAADGQDIRIGGGVTVSASSSRPDSSTTCTPWWSPSCSAGAHASGTDWRASKRTTKSRSHPRPTASSTRR
jgi:hypothetical protein